MTPEQFLDRLKKNGPAPAYLFLGPEAYQRERCRRALVDAVLGAEDRESGFTRHDLDQIPLAAAIDDARSLSLFASRRVIWLAGAEAAVPRGKAAAFDDEEGAVAGDAAQLAASPATAPSSSSNAAALPRGTAASAPASQITRRDANNDSDRASSIAAASGIWSRS